ncbi:MAG: squalene synthase HpnC [Zoogloeaceae bacterium]|jgi:squalene synthase HpnC|nr:squalene synthase HpnC [Zoogloeaceae bacterium]
MPVDHYENFPVASLLLPKALRAPIEAIYQFARAADDIADEGDAPPAERLHELASFHAALDRIEARAPHEDADPPLFLRLAPVIRQYALPFSCFHELHDAFAQDVRQTRYADYPELLDYCRRSANPVGRLVLRLCGAPAAVADAQSDAICSALQLINFWQDVAIDWQKERIYLPQEDLQRFGVTEQDIAAARVTPEWRALLAFQVERTRALMLQGAPLCRDLPGRLGWEIRLTVQGGLRILEKIEQADYDVFRHRPTLGAWDWFIMTRRAFTM